MEKPTRPDYQDECDCCGFKTTELTPYERNTIGVHPELIASGNWRWLCDLCANTMANTYTDHNHRDAVVLQTICHIGNRILAMRDVENEKMMIQAWLEQWKDRIPEDARRSLQTIINVHF